MKKFVLIDGNAIVHRAYHALPNLSTKEGTATNAVYGFFAMLTKIINDLKPDYFVVCFDRGKPTFRKSLYVGYQATRPKMDDGLSGQFKLIHEALEKAKVEIFEIDGYEADDLIGTLATQASVDKELETIIVTGDRDLLQLVENNVKILAPIVGITKMILFDSEKVQEKYGLHPHQFIDYKALVGDNSDNYPGVTGVGPKTAANLLHKYETFENLYSHLSDLPENLSLKLATDAEQAALAKKLATIVRDAPVTLELGKASMRNFNTKDLYEYFNKLGMRSLVGKIKLEEQKEEEEKKKEPDQLDLL